MNCRPLSDLYEPSSSKGRCPGMKRSIDQSVSHKSFMSQSPVSRSTLDTVDVFERQAAQKQAREALLSAKVAPVQ